MASLDELTARLKATGHDYLPDAEAQRYVKEAVSELGLQENWPWRWREDVVAAGNVIPDRGNVLEVRTFQGWPITPEDPAELREEVGPMSTLAGTQECYWVEGRSLLRCWRVPTAEEPLTVAQYARILWTSGGGSPANGADTPLIPDGFDDLIVDTARIRALKGTDEAALIQMTLGVAAQRMTELRDQELVPNADEGDYVRTEGTWA
jgi:hypothetical protein